MARFIVDPQIWNLFPTTKIAFVTARGIDNEHHSFPTELLAQANANAVKWVPNDPISNNEIIQSWRSAYQQFKTKKGARSAIENLLKRAKNGKGVTSINPIVDMYNTVSLNYAFPLGSQDMDKIVGDIQLTMAAGGENFLPIGETENMPALPGEVVYRDDQDIISRCWAWRDSGRTETTSTSKNLVFYMENIDPNRHELHEQAVEQLTDYLKTYFDVDAQTYWLDADHSEITF